MRMTNAKLLPWVAAAFFWMVVGEPAFAQSTYPERPVHIVVPFASGGSSDAIARICADWLTKRMGAPFIVENRPGASGALAAKYVAGAQPDGQVLFLAGTSQFSILPNMTKTPFDPLRDFAPISIVANNGYVLAVNNSLQVDSLAQFLAYVRARPGKLSYASAGSSTPGNLSMALLLHRAGLEMAEVTYKGGAPATADVVGGQLPVLFGLPSDVLPQVRAGKLRALAVSGAKRTPDLPQVPTVAEQGFPGFDVTTWNGLVAPANTPKPIIERIAAQIAAAVMDDKDYVARMRSIGVEAEKGTPAEFARLIRHDLQSWAETVRITGATIQ